MYKKDTNTSLTLGGRLPLYTSRSRVSVVGYTFALDTTNCPTDYE